MISNMIFKTHVMLRWLFGWLTIPTDATLSIMTALIYSDSSLYCRWNKWRAEIN